MDPIVKIVGGCLESMPCQHHVIYESGRKDTMFWPDIVHAFVEAGRPAPTHPGSLSLEEEIAEAPDIVRMAFGLPPNDQTL